MTRYLISLDVEEDGLADAETVLKAIGAAIGAGMTTGGGMSELGTEWAVTAMDESDYPHGDYRDPEGNLVHVRDDMVVSVTHANGDAETEDVEVPVALWERQHGSLIPAAQADAVRYRDAAGNIVWVLDEQVVRAVMAETGQVVNGIEVPLKVWTARNGELEEYRDE